MLLKNYFNFKKMGREVLITNDAGQYLFLEAREFQQLVTGAIQENSELFRKLAEKWFITDSSEEIFCSQLKDKLRRAKNHLLTATGLFIFVVTSGCNLNCVYCQARSGQTKQRLDMDLETARRGVDIALASPGQYLTIEFQGGEPLLNFPAVKEIIEYCNLKNTNGKIINYSMVSNLLLLDEEMWLFLTGAGVSLSTSLDGAEGCHNRNRPDNRGEGTFAAVREKIAWIKSRGGNLNAIQTTTRQALSSPKQLVDAYLDAGLDYLFIRPLTPLGVARETWSDIGYSAEEFVAFYKECLDCLIDLNKEGIRFREGHAMIWLQKILHGFQVNYMELRSPCGASTGQMAFYCDGNAYTCDEGRMLAEMENRAFLLGSLKNCSYSDLVNSGVAKITCSASILEALPGCCDCVYQPYCGACPVISLATEGNIFPKSAGSYRCKLYSGMLDAIFRILQRNDLKEVEILKSWV
jgi:His-Xaa-Ser system radical SAM maturase HxsB